MDLKFELNATEVAAIRTISETYKYISAMENILTAEEKASLGNVIKSELEKFRNPDLANIAHGLIKIEIPEMQRTMLWRLPIKVGQVVTIQDENRNNLIQGIVTANPNSVIPYDEPSKDVDSYTYYINNIPFVINNEEHWVFITGNAKYFKVPKKIWWG